MAHPSILSHVVEGLKLTPSCSWTSHPNGCCSSVSRVEPSAAAAAEARPSDSSKSTGSAPGEGGPKNTFASPSKSQLLLFQKDKCSSRNSSSQEASNCHCCCCCSRASDIDIIRTVWILPESASVLVIMHNTAAAEPERTSGGEVDLSSLVSSSAASAVGQCVKSSMAANERTSSSDFIPLHSDHHTLLLRNSHQSNCSVQHRNRTKRKRESSSVSRHDTNGDAIGSVEKVLLNGDSKSAGEKSLKSSEQNGPVWKPHTREYSKSGIIRLHEEIEDFFEWMVPTPEEHSMRLEVVSRIRDALKQLWPEAKLDIFGSFRTGLYLPSSDIDLVLFGKWPNLPLQTIERVLLEKKIALEGSVKTLAAATVPIVKLTDRLTGVKVDISFNMNNGIRTAELIKHYKKRYPSLPKLIYILKEFLLERDLNEVFKGGLSSYALILLVVSFLQLHQRQASMAHANLGVLLIEFLELYGRTFNYLTTGIRIKDEGSYVPKTKLFPGDAGTICIEDPLDPNNDVGRSSYGVMNAKAAFERAYVELTNKVNPSKTDHENQDNESILSCIISVPESLVASRAKVSRDFASLPPYPRPHDPHREEMVLPPRPIPVPSADVVPQKLELRHFSQQQPVEVPPPTPASTAAPTLNAEPKLEDSDNLSSVSTGTSTSASQSTPSDTDSDAIIPSTSPSSLMSISPATSDVGSFVTKQQSNRHKNQKPLTSTQSSFKQHQSVKTRPTYWGTCRGKDASDRADMDLNWRQQQPQQQSRPMPPQSQKPTSDRADRDTNWRNHDSPAKERTQWTATSRKSRKSKKQASQMNGGGGRSSSRKPKPQPPTEVVDNQPPVDNERVVVRCENNNPKEDSSSVSSSTFDNGTIKTQKYTKKRKKGNKNREAQIQSPSGGGGETGSTTGVSATADKSSSVTVNNSNSRFSRRAGLGRAGR